MPTTVTLQSPFWTDYDAQIPDACPKCSADLTQRNAVIEWDWHDVSAFATLQATSAGGLGFDLWREGSEGDSYHPTEVRCASCSFGLSATFEPVEPPPSSLSPGLLRGLEAMAEIAKSDLERGPDRYSPDKLRDLERAFAWLRGETPEADTAQPSGVP